MNELTNSSVIGRLLEEISWEKATAYRHGGRGRENVLTAEVLMPLDYLPREIFLAEVLRGVQGATAAANEVAAQAEDLRITLLPDEVLIGPGQVRVQPDGYLEGDDSLVLIEAKRIRRSSFQPEQLAREVVALLQEARQRRPLLLLILGAPPPVLVKGVGPADAAQVIADMLPSVLAKAKTDDLDPKDIMQQLPDLLAWTTWAEVRTVVAKQAGRLDGIPPSLAGTVRRLVEAATGAIEWHT